MKYKFIDISVQFEYRRYGYILKNKQEIYNLTKVLFFISLSFCSLWKTNGLEKFNKKQLFNKKTKKFIDISYFCVLKLINKFKNKKLNTKYKI